MSVFDSLLEGVVEGLEPSEEAETTKGKKKKKVKQLLTPREVREAVRKWNIGRPEHMRVRIKEDVDNEK